MEQLNLFEENITPFPSQNIGEPIEVVKVNFEESSYLTWKELFTGYDRMYAITFSYGLKFIEKILQEFDYAEIILGCEPMVKFDLQTLIAHQELSIKELKKHKSIVDKIDAEEVTFFVSKDIVSHQKVFILESNNMNTRVILGSGNLSERSFSGEQIENIEIMDNDVKGFQYYMERFNTLRTLSSTEIVKDSLFINGADETNPEINIDDLPIAKEVKMNNVGIIIEESKQDPEMLDYVYNLQQLSKEYSSIMPKKDNDGKILLTGTHITKMVAKQRKQNENNQKKRAHYPQFNINYESGMVSLNNKQYDLNPDITAVTNDLETLLEYFQGFEQFEGDITQLKKQYFNMLNYMLLSPFVAKLRYHAHLTDFPTRLFPLYSVLCGKSDAGKSAFIETIHTLMFGRKLGNISPTYFTKSSIYELQRQMQGVPAHIEDLMNNRFNQYCGEIVKYDEDLIQEVLLNHPTFILSSNDIRTIKPEFSKRILVMYIEGNLPKIKATTNHKKMLSLRKALTTSFYSEYLRRMLPAVSDLIAKMEAHDNNDEWVPDIFDMSSRTIIEIFNDCNIPLPEFIRKLTYNDYFGSAAIGSRVYNRVRRDWKYNSKAFKVSRKQNKLEYQPGEKAYEAVWVYNELPTELRAECSGVKVIMELDKAIEFFGITFRKSIFER